MLKTSGLVQTCPRTGQPGRPRTPRLIPPRTLVYAMGHTRRRKGRVVTVSIRRVCGTARQLAQALARAVGSTHGNTTCVERVTATVRQHNSRKARKGYPFSQAIEPHQAMSGFAVSCYHFCRPHPGLRRQEDGHWRARTPAMAAGLSHHVWSLHEFLRYPRAPIPL